MGIFGGTAPAVDNVPAQQPLSARLSSVCRHTQDGVTMGEQPGDHDGGAPPACPTWCRRDHSSSNHPEDRVHQSEPRRASVVVRRSPPFSADEVTAVVEVLVQAVQDDLGPAWIRIEQPEDTRGSVTLSVGSAQRLCVGIGDVLADLPDATTLPNRPA